jgi:cell division protein FtsZ
VRVTVIAAGFDAGAPTPVRRVETRRQPDAEPAPARPAPGSRCRRPPPHGSPPSAAARAPGSQPAAPPRRTVVFEDDLDVPDFLK